MSTKKLQTYANMQDIASDKYNIKVFFSKHKKSIIVNCTILLIIGCSLIYYCNKDAKETELKKNEKYKYVKNHINNEKIFETELEEKKQCLYEKVIDNNITIRVINNGYILGQKQLVGIQKTTDGGNTWEEQLQTEDKVISINNNAKIIFLSEDIGFINNLSPVGRYRGLLVTVDGGKNFVNANINISSNNKENLFYVEELPYKKDEILKVKLYTVNNNRNPQTIYYEFYSEDNGLNWRECN